MVGCLKYQEFMSAFEGKIKAKQIFSKVKSQLEQKERKFWSQYLKSDKNFFQGLKKHGFKLDKKINPKFPSFLYYIASSGYPYSFLIAECRG